MKCQIPQICWHSRDPVLSIDFQPIQSDFYRLASGGTDSHVLIWYLTYSENKSVQVECASDLYRHNKSVNVVRFSPNGEVLASGDDEGAMFIWQLKEREQTDVPKDDEIVNKEEWYPVKLLRGHLEDIYDICWSKDGNFLVSASMDNTAIIWDMQKFVKVHIFSEFKGYVQGVSWDPQNQFIGAVGSDRTLRILNVNSKKTVCRVLKAPWSVSSEKGTTKARLFYDDTLKSYVRRLTFTPDGELLIVPSGIVEKDEKFYNTCYIFSRYTFNKPLISLPTGDKYTIAVRCNPFLFKLRGSEKEVFNKENDVGKPMINLPYRMIFAVAASDSILMYDTQQLTPFAYVSNIHYTHLTDLTWSPDGLILVASSTDGYCSFITFTKEELGEIYIPEEIKADNLVQPSEISEKMDVCSSITNVNNEKNKTNSPTTPKSRSAGKPRTPKETKTVEAVIVTPSNQSDKSSKVSEVKSSTKKSPKMYSIKNFFITTKSPAAQSVTDCNKVKDACKSSEDSSKDETSSNKPTTNIQTKDKEKTVVEVITVPDTPEKVTKDSLNPNHNLPGSGILKASNKEEKMDIDNDAAESEEVKQTKCRVRLDFADKIESVMNINENASDGDTMTSDSSKCVTVKENNDWKLELSQDEAPMEISESTAAKKVEIKQAAPTKRRIALVTLSTKTSFTSPKK